MERMPLVISHRGRCDKTKFDNTTEAFRNAIACGAHGIEFDVRRTRDGQLIVFHDKKIGRKKVRLLTYSAVSELAARQGYEVSLLSHVLAIVSNTVFAAIELKESGYEEQVLEVVSKHLDFHEYIIISFLPEALRAIKRCEPRVQTGLLFHSRLRLKAKMKYCRPDVALPLVKLLKKPLPSDGRPVIAWGVNDERTMLLSSRLGLFGIITDFPEKALEIFSH